MFETNVTLSKDNHHKAKSPRQMEPEYGHPGRSAQSPPVALLLWVNDFHNQTAFRNFHNLSVVCILSHYISNEKKICKPYLYHFRHHFPSSLLFSFV